MFRDWLPDACATTVRRTERSRPRSPPAASSAVMDYNNHKAELVYDIYERAFAADPDHPHDPRPRR